MGLFQNEYINKGKPHPLRVNINSTSRKQIQRNISLLYNLLILTSRHYQLKKGRKTQHKNTQFMF